MKPTAGIDRASSNLRMTSHAVAPPRRESRATSERICGEVRIGGPGRQHYAGDTFGAARSQGWRRGCIEEMAASQVTGPGSGRLTEPLRGANGHTKPNLPSRRVLLGAWDSTLVWRFPPEGAAAGEFRDARDWIAIEPRLCRCFQEASSARFGTPGDATRASRWRTQRPHMTSESAQVQLLGMSGRNSARSRGAGGSRLLRATRRTHELWAPRHSEWVLLTGPHPDDAPAVWPLKLRSLGGRALRVTPRPTGSLPSKPSLCRRFVRLCDGGNGAGEVEKPLGGAAAPLDVRPGRYVGLRVGAGELPTQNDEGP